MPPASSSSAAPPADPRRRRFVRRGLAIVVLVWLGAAAWSVLSARAALTDARRDARALLRSSDSATFDELRAELVDVGRTAERAEARLDDVWVRPLDLVPVLGRQVRSSRALSHAASGGLDSVLDVVDAVERSRQQSDDAGSRPDVLRGLAEEAERAAASLGGVDLGPSDGLFGTLRDARAEVGRELADAEQAMGDVALIARGLAELVDGTRRYLVLAGNNAQMQNGSGMFLNAGEMVATDGDLHLLRMEPTFEMPPQPTDVPLEPALAERWGWLDPNVDFRHLGVSPRFPVTAATARELWSAMGRNDVDGVIAVDVVALEALLEIVGPVEVEGGPVDARNVRRLLLHDQYLGLDDDEYDLAQLERRSRQSDIAVAALNRLTDRLDGIDLGDIRTLVDAVRGRHLLLWSADEEEQARWEALDAAGALNDRSMMLSLVNRSGVKLDWFLRVRAEIEVTGGGPTRDVAVRVNVRNRAPTSGQPRYVIGPFPGSGVAPGTYVGVLALTLPADASGGEVEGESVLPVVGSEGPHNRVVGALLQIPAGETVERVFRFTVAAGDVVVEPSGRAEPTRWQFAGRRFTDAQERVIEL